MIFMMYWRVLLLCLAVLLPWRSTLAVTMAMTPSHHSTPAAMDQAPCPHHASASDQGSSTDGTTDHASCDVCHVPAMSADLRTATRLDPEKGEIKRDVTVAAIRDLTQFFTMTADGAGGASAPVTQFAYDDAGRRTSVTNWSFT